MRRKLFFMALCICVCAHGAMHIHTDASDYRVGGRIWFRVHDFYNTEEVLFAELITPKGTVSKRVKLLRWDDIFCGYIDIPTTCEAGQYLIRTYTRDMMEHMEDAGRQIVYIHGRIEGSSTSETVPAEIVSSHDTTQLRQALMPIQVTHKDGYVRLDLDTLNLLAGEHVYLSVSVNDRYAIAQHWQWTIAESLTRRTLHYPRTGKQGAAVKGKIVTPIREKAIAGAIVNMIVPGTFSYASDTTDSEGHFAFQDEIVPDGVPVLISALMPNGRKNMAIRIEEDTFPGYYGVAPERLCKKDTKRTQGVELNDIVDSVLLQEIEVVAQRSYESKREQYSMHMADASFGLSKIEEYSATCLHDLLRRVPGVTVMKDQCFIRGAHSIYAKNPAAIAINGVIQEGDYDLDIIPMQDIARVDIFKSGTTVIWGARGGAGVISIILKDGTEIPKQTDQSNLKRCRPLGWQNPQTFHIEQTDANRRPVTIYWEPNLRSGTILLPVVRPTVYDVLIEGTTDRGRFVHERKEIEMPL